MQFETLVQELKLGPSIVSGLLAGVSQSEARVKPDLESWSMLEVVCHLTDEEREDFRVRLDIILHRPKEAWPPIRPGEWVTTRKYNEQDLGEMLARFKLERKKSLEWLNSLADIDWEAACETPWGAMKAGDMLSAWVAHDNLHTRQLVELRRGRILRITEPYDVKYAGDW